MKKRQEYQKENARILVSRSCGDQLIEVAVERRGGGEGMIYKRVEKDSVPHMEIIYKNNLVNLLSQV